MNAIGDLKVMRLVTKQLDFLKYFDRFYKYYHGLYSECRLFLNGVFLYLNAYLMKILHMLQAFPSIISNYIAKKLKVMRLITNRFFFFNFPKVKSYKCGYCFFGIQNNF